ncbi:MAG: hypothetical protein ACKVQQ_12840 [Burkholderiales bacterium]
MKLCDWTIRCIVQSAEEVIHQLARHDVCDSLIAKKRAEETMLYVQDVNNRIGPGVQEIDQAIEQVAEAVRSAVTALRFQDLAPQLVGYTGSRLLMVEAMTHAGRPGVHTIPAIDATALARTARNRASQDSMSSGAVKLFWSHDSERNFKERR